MGRATDVGRNAHACALQLAPFASLIGRGRWPKKRPKRSLADWQRRRARTPRFLQRRGLSDAPPCHRRRCAERHILQDGFRRRSSIGASGLRRRRRSCAKASARRSSARPKVTCCWGARRPAGSTCPDPLPRRARLRRGGAQRDADAGRRARGQRGARHVRVPAVRLLAPAPSRPPGPGPPARARGVGATAIFGSTRG